MILKLTVSQHGAFSARNLRRRSFTSLCREYLRDRHLRRPRPELAQQVSAQLMAHDALGAHARDELQVSTALAARPVQAALTSAASFAVGAALPLAVAVVSPASSLLYAVAGSALVFLALLGALAAHTGGAGIVVGAWRVTFWGALAMAITAGVGAWFGAPV